MGSFDPSNRDIPFGNKIMVFGGDLRQILPVVRKGTRTQIVKASFNRSLLWEKVKVIKLAINMRINSITGSDQIKAKELIDFLLRVGEGREQTYIDPKTGYDDLIKLPPSIAAKMTMKELILHTYPNIQKRYILFFGSLKSPLKCF